MTLGGYRRGLVEGKTRREKVEVLDLKLTVARSERGKTLRSHRTVK